MLRSFHPLEHRRSGRIRRPRRRRYGEEDKQVLRRLWEMLDYVSGRRLAAALPDLIESLGRHGEPVAEPPVRARLLKISASTIDRLLSEDKRRMRLKGRGGTKPGTLLRRQVPIRTFADCDEACPGFMEMDLVGHEGGLGRGDYAQTLDVTDVQSGWTELEAVRNKAQVWVFEALQQIRERLPFELLGLDSDNGGEFINYHLYHYCEQEQITFTRSRPLRKNDNCFVEQKNYSVVRRFVGYARYDTEAELRRRFRTLNPAQLHREIVRLQEKLAALQGGKRRAVEGAGADGKVQGGFPTAPWETPRKEFPTPPTTPTASTPF